jgi:hypothetical protein
MQAELLLNGDLLVHQRLRDTGSGRRAAYEVEKLSYQFVFVFCVCAALYLIS